MERTVSSQLSTLTDEMFDELMSDAPPKKSANAADIIGGEKKEVKEEKQVEEKKEPEVKVLTPEERAKQISLALGEEEDEHEEEQVLDSERSKAKTKEEEFEEADEDKDEPLTHDEFFKNKAKALIEKGAWADFEGFDEYEWNEDNYVALAEQQATWKAEEKYESMVEASGDYGKSIIEHVKNGGDPDKLIDLFKRSQENKELDISTADGQVELIKEYYKNDLNWSDVKVKRYIDSLRDSGDDTLAEEAKEIKGLRDESIKDKIEKEKLAAAEYKKEQAEAEQRFAQNITTALRERTDISTEDKKAIYQSLLTYDKKLPNGRVVNQFTVDFMKMQSDPQKYVDLVLFVKDSEKFVKGKAKADVKTNAKKTWNLIKGNSALSKSTGTSTFKKTKDSNTDLIIPIIS